MLRAIGLMSGTSLDGVDAAWLETDGERIGRLGPSLTLPYDAVLRADLQALLDRGAEAGATIARLAASRRRLTERHVEAVPALGRRPTSIGFHGQTILHQPQRGLTWQIGDAARLAHATGMPVGVISAVRTSPPAGEGAPLAPVYHAALAGELPRPVAVLNIGGVANVTWIGADGGVLAFDTGPGNGPLDDWAPRHTGRAIDRGRGAGGGGAGRCGRCWRGCWPHPYFARRRRNRWTGWISRCWRPAGWRGCRRRTGRRRWWRSRPRRWRAAAVAAAPRRWLVCGGGRRNPSLMAALGARPAPVAPVEAAAGMAMRWRRSASPFSRYGCCGAAVSFPGTTGVARPCPAGGRPGQDCEAGSARQAERPAFRFAAGSVGGKGHRAAGDVLRT